MAYSTDKTFACNEQTLTNRSEVYDDLHFGYALDFSLSPKNGLVTFEGQL